MPHARMPETIGSVTIEAARAYADMLMSKIATNWKRNQNKSEMHRLRPIFHKALTIYRTFSVIRAFLEQVKPPHDCLGNISKLIIEKNSRIRSRPILVVRIDVLSVNSSNKI